MSDIETIHRHICERVSELEALETQLSLEWEQLRKLAAILDDDAPAGRPARPTRSRSKRDARRHAPTVTAVRGARPTGHGGRAQQALHGIHEKPGVTAAELASAMGIRPNYLYRVLAELERAGKVTKQATGYHPAPSQ